MSGISHLYDIYNKKGKEFMDNLFNSYVTINEKMDGSAFIFERDIETGNFNFYKGDQRNPITLVDRTLMKYYEKPINYIESLAPEVLNRIPRGWKFGLEYFSNNKPVEIEYDRLPKNNLIISYIHAKNEKSVSTIVDKDTLNEWADIIGIERPTIIFQGILLDEQKNLILDFLKTPSDQLVSEYKTKSFVRYMIGVLNPEAKTSALNEDLDKPIEGIVFKFEKGDSIEKDAILAKMVDPVFSEMVKDRYKKKLNEKPSDFLGITILDVMNFILEEGIKSFNIRGNSEDERYISFISDVFSKFLDIQLYKYKGADFQEPEYLKREEFRLNKDLIKDKRVIKYLEMDESFESLFKLILNSFRKMKKRASGIITSGIIDQFNILVSEIAELVSKRKDEAVKESVSSFLDFKKTNTSPKKVDYLTTEAEDREDDPFYSYNDFISSLETVDTKKKPTKNLPKIDKVEGDSKDLVPVNILIGRFQPFHNGHLKMVTAVNEKNDLPCILAVVYNKYNKSDKCPFNEDMIAKYMENVVRENSENIIGYFTVERGLLGPIYSRSKGLGFIPKLIGVGEDVANDYKKQCEYLKKIGNELPEDVEIIETTRTTNGSDVRKKLMDEDFLGFKKLVPLAVSNIYSFLLSSIKGKAIDETVILNTEESKNQQI